MLLENCLKISDKDLLNYLVKLDSDTITDNDNYVYLPGDNEDICLVVHIDTMRIDNRVKLVQHNNIVRNIHGILGADDRAGVYLALKLHKKHNCPVLFTNYEESGCKGVEEFCNIIDNEYLFVDTKLFIQLDRAGTGHYVAYNHIPHDTQQFVESFGLIQETGSFSDIAVLSDNYDIPSVNIAIGYYNEHTVNEYLNIQELVEAYSVVSDMLTCLDLLEFTRIDKHNQYIQYDTISDNYYNDDYLTGQIIKDNILQNFKGKENYEN